MIATSIDLVGIGKVFALHCFFSVDVKDSPFSKKKCFVFSIHDLNQKKKIILIQNQSKAIKENLQTFVPMRCLATTTTTTPKKNDRCAFDFGHIDGACRKFDFATELIRCRKVSRRIFFCF